MDVSSSSVLRTLTNTPDREDREEGVEVEGPSFAEFLGGQDHTQWFGDVIAQQQATAQNAPERAANEPEEPLTSVERAVTRERDRVAVERVERGVEEPEQEVRVEEQVEREVADSAPKEEKLETGEVKDRIEDEVEVVAEVVDTEFEAAELEVEAQIAGMMAVTAQTDVVKTSRFVVENGHMATQLDADGGDEGKKAQLFARAATATDFADESPSETQASVTPTAKADPKAPLSVELPTRFAQFESTESDGQTNKTTDKSGSAHHTKAAQSVDPEGEWMQMLQRNLPTDQVASRTLTVQTSDTVQLSSNRVQAIAGPALRVGAVERPPPTAATQRATPLHRAQLPEGVDEMTLLRQISDGLKIRPGQNQTAEIRLRPADLGRVLIQLQMSGDEARVVVTTENAAVGDLLAGGLDQLRRDIVAQGVHVTHMEVRQETGEDSRGNGQEQLVDDESEELEGRSRGNERTTTGRRHTLGRISVQA